MNCDAFWRVVTGLTLFSSSVLSASGGGSGIALPPGILFRSGLDTAFVAKFCLFVAVLLTWTIGVGKLLKQLFRMPVIAGQIVGGMLLGPSLVNIADVAFFAAPFSFSDYVSGQTVLIPGSDLFIFFILLLSSSLTVSYLLWIAGHETDIKDIVKIGVTALVAGILGALVPIGMTIATAYNCCNGWDLVQSISLGLTLAATSVSIPVAMLFASNKMHLKSSKATLGAAIVDDIFAVILLSLFFLFVQSGTFGVVEGVIAPAHGSTVSGAIGWMIVTFIVLFAVGLYVVPPVIRFFKKCSYSHLIAPFGNSLMLISFAFVELVGGLAGITGAYFAGLFHRRGDKWHCAEKVISPFVNAILLPLFLGSIGLQIDVRVLSASDWAVVTLMLVVAIISKLVGCWMATALSNATGRRHGNRWSLLETYLFGSSMVARGEVGLVVATILYSSRILHQHQYVIAVVVIVLTTIAAPIMLAIGFEYLDAKPVEGKVGEFTLNIGLFHIIGTARMFVIIVDQLEASGQFKTSVQFSEGRKVVNIEGQHIKIILCPDQGIIFEGEQEQVNTIIQMVKNALHRDVNLLTQGN